jgi:hypothetical protein
VKWFLLTGCITSLFTATALAGISSGPQDAVIRTCFVGNAISKQPKAVAFITSYLRFFENHGHLRFDLMGTGVCPVPTMAANGFEVHDGDLRIAVPNTVDVDGVTPINGLKLGKGCADPGTTGWWANFPSNRNDPKFRACRMNAYLRDNMPVNKILHELGHALGLVHEHERKDIPKDSDVTIKTCYDQVDYFGKFFANGDSGIYLLTPYDRNSVMHYVINHQIDPNHVPIGSTCDIGNDTGVRGEGLTRFDELTLRILYPHESRVAEYVGTTVVGVGKPINLQNGLGWSGALTGNFIISSHWTARDANRVLVSQGTTDLNITLNTVGNYQVDYSFMDVFGRKYSNTFQVKVLDGLALQRQTASLVSTTAVLFQ